MCPARQLSGPSRSQGGNKQRNSTITEKPWNIFTNSAHEALKAAPPPLRVYFAELRNHYENIGITIYDPIDFLAITHKEAGEVQEFLMQSFQLLMSSISVRESSLSAEQASRTTILTYLTVLYLPLTVATGVFEMNIKEINNGTLQFWWVIVVMLALMLSTVKVNFLLKRLEKTEQIVGK